MRDADQDYEKRVLERGEENHNRTEVKGARLKERIVVERAQVKER